MLLVLYLRDLCLTQGHKDFPVLKFSNFVFDSDPRSTFGYYVFSHIMSNYSTCFFRWLPSLHWSASVHPPSIRHLGMCVGLFMGSLFCPLIYPCLSYCTLKSGSVNTVLYESCFGYSRPFASSYKFKNQLINSYQKTCYDFVWNSNDSQSIQIWGELVS